MPLSLLRRAVSVLGHLREYCCQETSFHRSVSQSDVSIGLCDAANSSSLDMRSLAEASREVAREPHVLDDGGKATKPWLRIG